MDPKQKRDCPIEGCDYSGNERGMKMHLRHHIADDRERAQRILDGDQSAPTPTPPVAPAPAPQVAPTPTPPAAPTEERPGNDLQDAFHSECVDLCTYEACADVASRGAFHGTAKLFRAAAAIERTHIRRMIYSLGALSDSTPENMRKALESERDDVDNVMPGYLARARELGNDEAATLFEQAIEAEKMLRDLMESAAGFLDRGRDVQLESYWVCGVCGAPAVGLPPGRCEVCQADHRRFESVG